MNPAPPPFPFRPVPITVPITEPTLNPNKVNPLASVDATQPRVPPQYPKSDTATGGRNINHCSIPPKGSQTSSGAHKLSTSSHSQLFVPTRPAPTPWPKTQPFAAKPHKWQTQVAAGEGELNRTLHARDSEEIQKAMEKYYSRGSPTNGVGVGGMSGGGTDNPSAALVPMPQPISPPNPPTDAGTMKVSRYRAQALVACG